MTVIISALLDTGAHIHKCLGQLQVSDNVFAFPRPDFEANQYLPKKKAFNLNVTPPVPELCVDYLS